MNNILAACLLSSLIACTLRDDPYMPVKSRRKTGSSCSYGVSACRLNE